MTTETRTPLRDLPDGHDDQDSPWYVAPEHRDLYRTISPDPHQVAQARDRHRRDLDRRDDLELWNREHAKRAAGDRDRYRKWLRENTRADGSPRLGIVGSLDGAVARVPGQPRALTAVEDRFAMHDAIRHAAANRHAQARVAEEAPALLLERRTCHVCRISARAEIVRRADGSRTCDSCKRLQQLVDDARGETPDGTSRLEAVAAALGVSLESATGRPGGLLAVLGIRRRS